MGKRIYFGHYHPGEDESRVWHHWFPTVTGGFGITLRWGRRRRAVYFWALPPWVEDAPNASQEVD